MNLKGYYEVIFPHLVKEYGGRSARDLTVLYQMLLAEAEQDKENENYGWAWPTNEKLVKVTGIVRSRIKELVDILVNEKLVEKEKRRLPYILAKKNFYRPSVIDDEKLKEIRNKIDFFNAI